MIGPVTVAELFGEPNWDALLAEYEAEAAVKGTPPISAKLETYSALEGHGILFPYAAWHGGRLIGFITVLAAPLPHYGRVFAVSESFFVAKAHRMSGAGVRLLHMAETQARALGSPGLFVSAPFEGDLHKILPRLDYRETNRVFFKAFYDA
jgi:GNAT superfamily N-acetyltransferase